MVTLGVVLLLIGLFAHVPLLWTLGVLSVLIGAVLAIAGLLGRAVGGRRHYW